MKTKHYLQRYIAQKVKYLRKKQNMSQEELSERADLGLKYINQLENEKVISALELTPEEFFNFDSLEASSDPTDSLSLKRVNMKIKQLPVGKREKILTIFEDLLDSL